MKKLIKKYKNRRLYDTDISQYITVDDLRSYVIKKIDFSVEDAASGKDLTNATLLQILVETNSGMTEFFSDEMLRQFIVLAHHPLNVQMRMMMENMLNMMKMAV
jgi:polyhydroxyalkanoate synthesis repressor PhaR